MADAIRRLVRVTTLASALWLLSLLLIAGCDGDANVQPPVESAESAETAADAALPDPLPATLGGERFELELALNEPDRRRGLMHRESLPADRGMLFVFPDEAPRSFWMRNTRIDLDIIFLDRTGRIVKTDTMTAPPDVAFDVEPDRAHSGEPAQFVIELNRGTVHRLGLKRGDRIELPLATLKARAR